MKPLCPICLTNNSGCETFGCWMNRSLEKYVITFTSLYLEVKEKIIEAYSDYAAIDESQHIVDTQEDLMGYRVSSVVKMDKL
jgi:hypothetical protein